jgi:hypothetical protein
MSPHCGYRPRDERGWRVPREGTKARAVYDLMICGFKRSAIIEATGYNGAVVSTMMHCIRWPDQTNQLKTRYYVTPSPPRQYKQRQHKPSNYVQKLRDILGMSLDEARRVEREMIEKERRTQCQPVDNATLVR